MTEKVTITPQAGLDANDDPITASAPFTLQGLVAPGDTNIRYGADGDLDTVMFTVYLPLKIKLRGTWVPTMTALTDNFTITIGDTVCVGRAKQWDLNGRGGVIVSAGSLSGATP